MTGLGPSDAASVGPDRVGSPMPVGSQANLPQHQNDDCAAEVRAARERIFVLGCAVYLAGGGITLD